MAIRIDKFGGMIPKLDPSQLPDGVGALCHNFVASSGVLVPFSATGPFVSLHDSAGALRTGVPDGEVVPVTKGVKPTLKSRAWQCRPAAGNWLGITLVSFISYLDENGGRLTYVHHAEPLTWRAEMTERGMNLHCRASWLAPVTMLQGGPYYFRGPLFMFRFLARPGAYGGPSVSENLPEYLMPGSPPYSGAAVPLVNSAQNIYGEFQVTDYMGPVWNEDFMISDYAVYTYWFGEFSCIFKVDLNYTENTRQHYYFVTSQVDTEDREGPPSEISNLIVARPGQILTINTPHTERKVRLYRAGTPEDEKFRLIAEGEFTEYEDAPTPARAEVIPAFGNWTLSGAPDLTTFLRGSVMHPAGFAVAFYGDTVWASDRYRLHVWPEENSTRFSNETVIALAMAGDTVLVFTRGATSDTGKVHALAGNDPGMLASFQISESTPLLNVAGLCQVGNEVFWPTHDGLAVSNGAQVRIVTADYFTRADWQKLEPATMGVEAEHDCLYLSADFTAEAVPSGGDLYHHRIEPCMLPNAIGAESGPSGMRFRVNLKEDLAAVTTYSSYSGGPGTWMSRLYEFPQAVTFDFVRGAGSTWIDVVATVDGVAQEMVRLAAGSVWTSVDWPHGRFWQFTVKSEGSVKTFEALDRVVAAGQDVNVFGPDTPSFRNVRFNYPEPVELCALTLSCQSSTEVDVSLYADGDTTAFYTATVADGGLVRIPLASRLRAKSYRVECDTDVRIDSLAIAREIEAAAGEVIQEGHGGLISPWLCRQYVWANPVLMRSVRVHARSAVTMQLYYDDSTTPDEELEIAADSAWEHRVISGFFHRLRYCFVDGSGDAADAEVSAVTVATSAAVEAGAGGVHLVNAAAVRSLVCRFNERGRFSAVQVTADAYPVWVDMYRWGERDGKPAHTLRVQDDTTLALPWEVGEDATLWEFDLRTGETVLETRVSGFHIYPKTGVAAPWDGGVRVHNSGGPAPWLLARYEFDRLVRVCSRRVETVDGDPVWMQLYVDGAAWGDPLECLSGYEQYLQAAPSITDLTGLWVEARSVEFRFFESASGKVPADTRVAHAALYTLSPAAVQGVAQIGDYPYLWREYTFAHKGRFTSGQVVLRDGYEGLGYSVYLRLRGGAVEQRVAVTAGTVFALPSMTEESQWTVCVENPLGVKQVVLYAEESVKVGAGGFESRAVPGAPEWLRARYEWDDATVLAGLRVDASTYPVTLTATTDQGDLTVEVADGNWAATGWTERVRWAVLRFDDDAAVRSVRLATEVEVAVGGDGVVVLAGLPFYWGIRLRFADTGAWAGVSVDATAAAGVELRNAGAAYTAEASIAAEDPSLHRVKSSGETLQHALTDPSYGSLWYLDVTCTGTVYSVMLISWRNAAAGEVVQVGNDLPGVPSWYRTRYRWEKPRVPRSARVTGSGNLDLYCGGDKETISAGDDEHRISARHECTELVFDFDDMSGHYGAVVACEEHLAVASWGVLVRQADRVAFWRNKVLRLNESGMWGVVRARGATTVKVRPYGGSGWTELAMDGDWTGVFPAMTAGSEWELDVVYSGGELAELAMFTRQMASLEDGVARWRREGDPVCWLDRRVMTARPVSLSCGRLVATGATTVYVRDRDRVLLATQFVSGGVETFRFPRLDARREWVFDVVPAAGVQVEEFAVSSSMRGL